MNAIYFMGTSKGTSKKGNAFFCVNVLWLNYFGNWAIKALFVNEFTYDKVVSMNLAPGTAISISVDLGGGLDTIVPNTKFESLNLGILAADTPKK